MVKRILPFVLALTTAAATPPPPVRILYADAAAKEQAVRKAMAEPNATDAMLKAVHEAIASYETVVRRYPSSSYSDNALWQASRLALDAFMKFHQAADRDAAVRLLKRLAASYPTSKLAKQTPDALAQIEKLPAPPASAAPAATSMPAPIAQHDPAAASAPTNSSAAAVGAQRSTAVGARTAPTAAATAAPPTIAGPAPAPPATASSVNTRADGIATIKSIRRTVLPDAVRVVIELDGEVTFRQDRIPDPWRVFVDLPDTRAAASLTDKTLRFETDADIVRQVRIGRHPNNTTRVVLDANGVSSYSVYPLYEPYRLVIDCVRAGAVTTTAATPAPAAAAVPTPAVPRATPATAPMMTANNAPLPRPVAPKREPLPLVARQTAPNVLRRAPVGVSQHTLLLAVARAMETPPLLATRPLPPLPLSSPIAAPSPKSLETLSADTAATGAPLVGAAMPPPPSPPKIPGGLSIARQLGLGVSRIVIDPGHGGHDSGAMGKGVNEAELVLDVALRLEKLLLQVPGVEVILTRRTDDFVELPERTAMANREGADLFLSIHANASTSALAHGVETYFLNFATNLSAAAVAARENADSTQAMASLPDLVKAIALNTKVDESHELASHVQNALIERLRPANKTVKDLGVKQAPFVVLIGAVMPSVLAEISFLTNPQEARLLKNNAYRQRIAEALFDGVRKYQTSLKGATTISTQR